MKKTIIAVSVIAVFAMGRVTAFASTTTTKAPAKKSPAAHKKQQSGVCPVLGTKIADVSKAPKATYKGKTYYFCCPNCKAAFEKNPEKYIKKGSGKKATVKPAGKK